MKLPLCGAFFKFMEARERVRLAKESGAPFPWTSYPILRDFKFTNLKRQDDRTTRELKVIYDRHTSGRLAVTLLNCAIYRYFGTIEMARAVGWMPGWNLEVREHVVELARKRAEAGEVVFTTAYIVPNLGLAIPKREVVAGVLDRAAGLESSHERLQVLLAAAPKLPAALQGAYRNAARGLPTHERGQAEQALDR